MALAAGACARAAPPAQVASEETVCPEAVQVFTSADQVGSAYQEVARLGPGSAETGDTARSRRERAAALGANGLLLGGDVPVAIYIPEDAQAVREICGGGNAGVARAIGRARPDAVGYAIQGRTGTSAAPDTATSKADTADTARVVAATAPRPERVKPAEPGRSLTIDREMRQALSDVTRLKIVTEYREVKPGVLALSLGSGYSSATSVEYNLSRLERAYRAFLHYDVPVVLELWRGDRKIGEYTADGLLVGSRYSRPR
jgi:hypothetical protein